MKMRTTTEIGTTAELQSIFIVIDALDECSRLDNERQEVLDLINEMGRWSHKSLHLLVTSRKEADIEETLRHLLTHPPISIQGSQVAADIELFIDNRLETGSKFKRLPPDLKLEIRAALVKGANGMFRWVFCQLEALEQCPPLPSSIRKALDNLPPTLYETYERILAGIEGEDSQRIAHNCLLWLAFSQRPLSLGELAEAAILNGEYSELERLPDCRCVTELLGSLVTVSPQWESSPLFSEDEAEELNWRIINLAHSSVVDYLVSEQVQSSRAARFATNAIDANNFIAESCLRYIFYYDQSRFRTTTLRDLSIFPMLQYVCEFWFVHTKMVPVARQEPLSPIINNLFSSNTALLNCSRVYRPDGGSSYYDHHEALTVNPLFYATSIGSQDLLQHLLEAKGDINTRTKDGMTALHVAITCGHEPLVSLLLEAGADVNAENNAGETPLHKAVNRGKQKLIRQLLDAGANPNTINTLERTPLLCSIFSGHESVVQLLLESGADPNKRSDEKVWPLESSVSGRHVTITRLLLNSKADIDTKGFAGNTVLHKAVSIGDEPMVRLLLQYGPNVDEQNEIGQTALHLAALGGDVSNVDLLIKAGAKLDAIDIYGSTALDFAARYSHQAVFELLVAAASSS